LGNGPFIQEASILSTERSVLDDFACLRIITCRLRPNVLIGQHGAVPEDGATVPFFLRTVDSDP